MSGISGFHRSSGDVNRSFAGSRAFSYEGGGGMKDILGGGGGATPTLPPRAVGGVAAVMGGEDSGAPSQASGKRIGAPPKGCGNAMADVMGGIGTMGVDDGMYGLRSIKPAGSRYAGNDALAALRGEPAEAGMEDPFAHTRARPKRHPRDLPSTQTQPATTAPSGGGGDAAEAGADGGILASLKLAHAQLLRSVAAAARDASGALVEYRSLLVDLEEQGINLSAEGAGTLIASLDVEGTISFESFMECIAMGYRADPPPPAATAAAAPPPPRACSVRGVPAPVRSSQPPLGAANPSAASWTDVMVQPPSATALARQNVSALLGGRRVAAAATSHELAALLNGSVSEHARRTQFEPTVGKKFQMR